MGTQRDFFQSLGIGTSLDFSPQTQLSSTSSTETQTLNLNVISDNSVRSYDYSQSYSANYILYSPFASTGSTQNKELTSTPAVSASQTPSQTTSQSTSQSESAQKMQSILGYLLVGAAVIGGGYFLIKKVS